ncbi:glycosyltransferase family 4 protein [Bacteroides sp. GD17]|jgi:glycosyltransferase involved in cell wall biosynthesis|uniref:glycosyltransferase family 4 protein n=1 Tax=Bacteroides sp. GD17 TaxID=3139826 RepID=UPI00313E1DAA
MKIVYCLHSTFNSGGMERIVLGKANWLADHGYEVIIVTTEQHGRTAFFPIHPSIRQFDLGINYSDYNKASFIRKFVAFLAKRKLHKRKLMAFLNNVRADIVISTFGNELGLLPSINDGSKKIAEIHFSRFFRMQEGRKGMFRLVDYFRSICDKKHVSKYSRLVLLTNEDAKHWSKLKNIVIIPNFTLITHDISKQDAKRAISVGRLTYQKGYDILIPIWAKVVQRHSDWHLDIFGSGEDKNKLQELIEQYSISRHVTIHNPTPMIVQEYLHSSIYLLSSRYEGFPLVLCEALNYGLASVVMACKCGPKDLVVDGESGFLVDEGDIDTYVERTCQLIENKSLRERIGKNAHQRISQCFSSEVVMQQWTQLFDKLC